MYYRHCIYYRDKRKESAYETFAILAITLYQQLTIFSVFFFIPVAVQGSKEPHNEIEEISIAVYLLLLSVNLYKYRRVATFDQLEKKWANESKELRKRNGVLVIAFIVLLLGHLLGIAFYSAYTNHGWRPLEWL